MFCDDRLCGAKLLYRSTTRASLLGYSGQVTPKGYDNMTGVGTPNGQQFITALRHLEK